MISLDDVHDAARRIAGVAHRTPVMTSVSVDERTGGSVFFKCENLQRAGSFKIRGAYNRMSRLSDDALSRGVVAYSSGNHAQAVALAARVLGTSAVIVMPSNAPTAKRAAVVDYGGRIRDYDRATEDRESIAAEIAAQKGRTLVPPYEDALVMAGQGTTALELLEDTPGLDVLVVPVGGGGLVAGCATAAKALSAGIRVVGVEPAAGDDTQRSLAAGRRMRISPPDSICDGLAATVPGELTFEVNARLLDGVVTVSDDEVVAAMAYLAERMKLVTEPSGAVAAAAVLFGHVDVSGLRAGVVLSGGNVGASRLGDLFRDGSWQRAAP